MHRAARAVAPGFGQVEGFHDDALAGEGRVAVHEHGKNFPRPVGAAALLAGTGAAFDHRVDDLEVRRVERERQVDRTAARGEVGREAIVVLDVAVGQPFRMVAFELGKQVAGHLAHHVDQHVQATALGHADDDLLDAALAGVVYEFIHRSDEAFASFEREALLADVLGVKKALKPFGLGELLQDMALALRIIGRGAAHGLKTLLDPALDCGIGHIHEFGPDRATIGIAKRLEDLAQRHRAFFREVRVRCGKHLIKIGFGQPVRGGIELGDDRVLLGLERIQVGPARAEPAIVGDQRLDMDLLGRDCEVGLLATGDERVGLGALREGFDDRRMRHIAR